MYYVMIYLQHCKSCFIILVYFYVAIKFPKEGLIPWFSWLKKKCIQGINVTLCSCIDYFNYIIFVVKLFESIVLNLTSDT